MGGGIGVESTIGVGSTFSFTVRLEKDAPELKTVVGQAVELAGRRALVVCDLPSFREELLRYVSGWGMSACEAHTGADALAMLTQAAAEGRAFAVALLSLQHPREDAMTLARTIKADPAVASVELVLLPPEGVLGDAKATRETGIAASLPRPVERDELLRCLMTVLGKGTSASDPLTPGPVPLVTRHTLQERRRATGQRILVSDDHPVSQQVTRLLIEKLGYVVETVSNGVEAASRQEFALILMDCQMPVMDGYVATAEIRRAEGTSRHTPIVAFTASAGPRGRERCLQAGMDDFLEKPVGRDELMAALERWTSASVARETPAAPDGTPDAVEPIDLSVLGSLEEQLGGELLNQMIECQLAETEVALQRMKDAEAAGRLADLRAVAHRLKGGSMTLGFLRLGSLSARLEEQTDAGTPAERQEGLQRLRDAIAELRSWQHARRTSGPSH